MTPFRSISTSHVFVPSRLAGLLAAAGLALSACGGGGDGASAPPAAASVTLSGTAAAGLPLSGTVTVKDAKGVSRTVALDASGGYRVE